MIMSCVFLCAPNIVMIFGVSSWMTWLEANGSWNALTLAKGIFSLWGSASVSPLEVVVVVAAAAATVTAIETVVAVAALMMTTMAVAVTAMAGGTDNIQLIVAAKELAVAVVAI